MMRSRESSEWEDWEPVQGDLTLYKTSRRESFHFIVTSPSTSSHSEENHAVAYTLNTLAVPGTFRRRRESGAAWLNILRLSWRKGSVLVIVALCIISGYGAAITWEGERIAWFAGAKSRWQDWEIGRTTHPESSRIWVATSSTLDGGAALATATSPSQLSKLKHPTRYLFPGRIGEQETKAQSHLYQLGLLALLLNRTLVLPNVQRSRMGACYSHPFDLYYESDSLEQLGIPTISQSDFIWWTENQPETPLAQVVSMAHSKGAASHQIQFDNQYESILQKAMCVSTLSVDFNAYSALLVHPPDGLAVSERVHSLFARDFMLTIERGTGRKWKLRTEPDVLVIDYNLRYRLLSPSIIEKLSPSTPVPLPYSYLPYSTAWENLGTQLASSISPFIAIHWRIETLPGANIFPCGKALVEQLKKLEDRFPQIQTVYLATDYPLELLGPDNSYNLGIGEALVAHSSTLTKELTEEHHIAMRSFLTLFNEDIRRLKLTSFLQEEPNLELPARLKKTGQSIEDVDPALIGFLDKIIMTQAEIFIAGEPGVNNCAKSSSFTEQIVEERNVARKEHTGDESNILEGDEAPGRKGADERLKKGELWNTVSHFRHDTSPSDKFLDFDG